MSANEPPPPPSAAPLLLLPSPPPCHRSCFSTLAGSANSLPDTLRILPSSTNLRCGPGAPVDGRASPPPVVIGSGAGEEVAGQAGRTAPMPPGLGAGGGGAERRPPGEGVT